LPLKVAPAQKKTGFFMVKVRPLIGKAKEGANNADNEDVDR
jgi:hypothetical protein